MKWSVHNKLRICMAAKSGQDQNIKMHDDELDMDVTLVQRLLRAQLPQWSTLPIKRIASSGTDNAIFQIGTDLCARFPRIEAAAHNIEKEHVWLPNIAPRLPIAISVPIAKGLPDEHFPWHWSICRWINGENAFNKPISDLTHCATLLAEFLLSFQSFDTNGGPYSRRAGALITQDALVRQALNSLSEDLDTNTLIAIWEKCLTAPAWNKPPVWTHGDLLPTNLLVNDDGKLCAVIDFDLMGIGDPACDLIVAWSVLSKISRKMFCIGLRVDEATWMRGMGWALSIALIIIPYYRVTNPDLVAVARRMIDEILIDWED